MLMPSRKPDVNVKQLVNDSIKHLKETGETGWFRLNMGGIKQDDVLSLIERIDARAKTKGYRVAVSVDAKEVEPIIHLGVQLPDKYGKPVVDVYNVD